VGHRPALRPAERAAGQAVRGGIMAGSDPGAELAETQAKFRSMQDALEG
jgi:isochorismate synthase EntC